MTCRRSELAALALAALAACSNGPSFADDDQFPITPQTGDCDPLVQPGTVYIHAHAGDTLFTNEHAGDIVGFQAAPTGADARLDVPLPGCGTVTLVDAARREYITITDIAVGEELWPWGRPRGGGAPQHVTVQIAAPAPDAQSYVVSAGGACTASGPGPTFDLVVDDTCTGADGMLSIAAQAEPALPVAVHVASAHVALAAASAGPVVLSAWQTPAPHELAAQPTGSGVGDVVWSLAAVVDGRALVANHASAVGLADGSSSAQVAYAEDGTAVLATYAKDTGSGAHRTLSRVLHAPFDSILDFNDAFLPPFGFTLLAGNGTCCVYQIEIDTSGATVAIVDAQLALDDSSGTVHWRHISPANVGFTTVAFPILGRGFDVPATERTMPVLTLYGASDLPDYRVARVTAVWARDVRPLPLGLVERVSINGSAP